MKKYIVIIIILLLAAALRFPDLERVPPPFNVDEAVNAYDAYSLLKTGCDQWGHPWPITMRAFNDYRRPATIYSAIPFMAIFGLTIYGIRAMAAFWGWLCVLFLYRLVRDMFTPRAGAFAALMLALAPWHIAFSRVGLEACGPMLFTVIAGLWCGWRWHRHHRPGWLIAAGMFLGLSLYTYTTTQAFTPLLLLICGLIFFREFWTYRTHALITIIIFILITAPLAWAVVTNDVTWNRLNRISMFQPDLPFLESLRNIGTQWLGHFKPGYLFIEGDAQPVHHPQGFGELYWVDALLVPLGMVYLMMKRKGKATVLLLAWLTLGPLPAALTIEDMGTAHSMRGMLGLPVWAIVSGLGWAQIVNWLQPDIESIIDELTNRRMANSESRMGNGEWRMANGEWRMANHSILNVSFFKLTLIGLLLGALVWNAITVLHHYYTVYPIEAGRSFEYGVREAMEYVLAHEDEYDTIVLTNWISQPHIFAVFFKHYDPRDFQRTRASYGDQLSEKLTVWGDKYITGDVDKLYTELDNALFVARPHMLRDVDPVLVINHPDGSPAFKIIVK
ncbi:MAG: glycosyltransferase family 39 protein [Anaerolineae bacterium]|nr:glycosyltransferase family 39 protein [Anaerolineae bacterium]